MKAGVEGREPCPKPAQTCISSDLAKVRALAKCRYAAETFNELHYAKLEEYFCWKHRRSRGILTDGQRLSCFRESAAAQVVFHQEPFITPIKAQSHSHSSDDGH